MTTSSAFAYNKEFYRSCMEENCSFGFDTVVIEVELGCFEDSLKITTCRWPEHRHCAATSTFVDYTLDPRSWRMYGLAIKSSVKISGLKVRPGSRWRVNRTVTVNSRVWLCIYALFSELKDSTNIKAVHLYLSVICALPIIGLRGLLTENHSISQLYLSFDSNNYQCSMTEANHIAQSLEGGIYIKLLIVKGNPTSSNVLETILTAAEFVSNVIIECYSNNNISTLCSRLRHANTLWQCVCFVFKTHTINTERVKEDVLLSLAGNRHLQVLEILINQRSRMLETSNFGEKLEKILCNSVSIRGILESNHSIASITVNSSSGTAINLICAKYLSLNMNWKKSNVKKMKIMKFYLSQKKNIISLKSLALSALIEVIALEVPVKASAIYNILQSDPLGFFERATLSYHRQ